ncbi:hypothetical protein Q8A73_016660 [Channa argus]|nr:hypothetical protein Q8A73_016660 [Channa argus]
MQWLQASAASSLPSPRALPVAWSWQTHGHIIRIGVAWLHAKQPLQRLLQDLQLNSSQEFRGRGENIEKHHKENSAAILNDRYKKG